VKELDRWKEGKNEGAWASFPLRSLRQETNEIEEGSEPYIKKKMKYKEQSEKFDEVNCKVNKQPQKKHSKARMKGIPWLLTARFPDKFMRQLDSLKLVSWYS